MPSKSPAQAKLMRAVAHGWKPDRMKGPSRAVAREFVNADRKYSGGFAENRYWTGGLAAMNEINSGVPQTLNFQSGGTVQDPVHLDMGDFRDILAHGWYLNEGWTWNDDEQKMYPPPPTDEPTILAEPTITAPATTGIGTPYVGGWADWGNYGDWSQYAPSEPEPAPVRDIPGAGTLEPITGGTGESTGSQWTPEQTAAWNTQQTTSDRQSPYRDRLRAHKATIAATLGTGNATGGRVDMDELRLRAGGRTLGRGRRGTGRGGRRGGGGGTIIPAPPPNTTVRDIPGAAPQPGDTAGTAGTSIWSGIGGGGGVAGAVFGAAKKVFGQSKWTPEQIAAWNAKETAKGRQSPHRDRLRAHKSRAADLLKPSRMPPTKVGTQPPVYGDAPEPGMAYAGGVPGWYSPGGPGYGGQLSGGGYGYEGDPSQPGYDDRSYEEFAAQQRITAPDITDEVLKARYEGRNANQGVIYTSGIGAAKGGYMNYQEGGAARPTPVAGGGAAIPGHPEGTNPFDFSTHPSSYRNWENKYHYDPPPPPPPPEPEEEPGWFSGWFGAPEVEKLKNRTQRYEEQMEAEARGEARGGYMRRYRSGGPVRRFQGGGLAQAQQQAMGDYNAGQAALRPPRGGIPPATGGQPRNAGGVAPRWSPQQQQAWRGARGNPAARSAMGQQYQQRQALMNRAPQAAGRAGMMADAQRQQQALQQRSGMAGAQADYQAGQQALAQRGARPAVMPGRGQMIGGGQGLAAPWQGDPANNPMRPRGPLAPGGRPLQLPGRGGPGRWTPQQRTQWGGAGAAERGAMANQYGQSQALRNRPGAGGGITGGARVPPNMQGFLQKQRMMNRPPSNVGGGVNRVGQQDQQGALSRAMQRGTGRRPMSRRGGFPGGGMR